MSRAIPDIAAVLGIGKSAAREAIVRGECGPLRIGRRLAVLRESFLAALADRERHVLPTLDGRNDAEASR